MASSLEHERLNASRLDEALAALRAIEERGLAPGPPTTREQCCPFRRRPAGVRREDE